MNSSYIFHMGLLFSIGKKAIGYIKSKRCPESEERCSILNMYTYFLMKCRFEILMDSEIWMEAPVPACSSALLGGYKRLSISDSFWQHFSCKLNAWMYTPPLVRVSEEKNPSISHSYMVGVMVTNTFSRYSCQSVFHVLCLCPWFRFIQHWFDLQVWDARGII